MYFFILCLICSIVSGHARLSPTRREILQVAVAQNDLPLLLQEYWVNDADWCDFHGYDGWIACSMTSCADIRTDVKNCGMCGNICENGSCVDGVCTISSTDSQE